MVHIKSDSNQPMANSQKPTALLKKHYIYKANNQWPTANSNL